MDLTIAIAAAGVFLIGLILLAIRHAELSSTAGEQKTQLTKLERDNRKLQQQLETKGKKLSKSTGKESKKKGKEKGRQQRRDQQQAEVQKLRTELKGSETKVQKLSRDLNRVRIDREEMRQKLSRLTADDASSKKKSTPDAAGQNQPTETADAADNADRRADSHRNTEEQQASTGPARSPSRLERDVERAEADVAKMQDRVRRYQTSIIERESELRSLRRRNEHNRRAYIITQLQLDLANDEIYVLQHGEPPPYKQADKQKKRAALRGGRTEPLEILNRDNPIDLTQINYSSDDGSDASEETAEATEPVNGEATEAEPAANAETTSTPAEPKPTSEATPEPTPAVVAAAEEDKKTDVEVAKPAEDAAKPVLKRPVARGSLLDQLKSRGNATRLRKKAGSDRAVAPPRPDSPPRPGGE